MKPSTHKKMCLSLSFSEPHLRLAQLDRDVKKYPFAALIQNNLIKAGDLLLHITYVCGKVVYFNDLSRATRIKIEMNSFRCKIILSK